MNEKSIAQYKGAYKITKIYILVFNRLFLEQKAYNIAILRGLTVPLYKAKKEGVIWVLVSFCYKNTILVCHNPTL